MLASRVSLFPEYVKLKGTCAHCKSLGADPETTHIAKGDLFWKKGLGRYMKKYHFDCLRPKFGGWEALDATEPKDIWVLDAIEELEPADQARVRALYTGEVKPAGKSKSKSQKRTAADVEDAEEAEEAEAEAELPSLEEEANYEDESSSASAPSLEEEESVEKQPKRATKSRKKKK